jgi:hypothetical protein
MVEEFDILIEQRKKLCNASFFSKVIGYTRSWISQAEAKKVNVSRRFIEDYKRALKKIEDFLKK